MEGHAVEVVDVAVLPIVIMEVVFGHGGLRAVENRGLVHVIPDPGIWGRADELFEVEKGFPPDLGGRIEAVDPVGRAGPAPAFVNIFAGLVHDTEAFVDQFITDGIVLVILDVGVDNRDKLLFISNHLY